MDPCRAFCQPRVVPGRARRWPPGAKEGRLRADPEVDHVAVLDDVVLSFEPEGPVRPAGGDRARFHQLLERHDLGLPDRALDRLLQAAYRLLGLISFLTAGDDECRAWSIPAGTPAVRAAGAIHSDIERGFIRAEVVPWAELLDAGSFAACRTRGTLRLEGRDYVVQDGDVINFRFNV